jgi:3-hydroxyacyl-CoA dehydrogenase
VLAAIEKEDFGAIDALVRSCQSTFQRVKFAPFPAVGAVAGSALGGGCEILLHCAAIQAHSETNMGLVEPSIGLIPAGGGCKEMLLRLSKKNAKGPVAPALAAFELISGARISASAQLAREAGYLRAADRISMNRDRVLSDAKAFALSLADAGYQPPQPVTITLGGPSAREALRNAIDTNLIAGRLKPHDAVVGEALSGILSGGGADPIRPVTEEAILTLEREAFLALVRTDATKARIKHMLTTGTPGPQ